MSRSALKGIQAAAGAAAGGPTYVEDVFSTFLYEGTASSMSVNNGIDLAGEGGLVWIKNRSTSADHHLGDTARGVSAAILHSNSSGQGTDYGAYGFRGLIQTISLLTVLVPLDLMLLEMIMFLGH